MNKSKKDLFDIIEETKVKLNEERIKKGQSIQDFLTECEKQTAEKLAEYDRKHHKKIS